MAERKKEIDKVTQAFSAVTGISHEEIERWTELTQRFKPLMIEIKNYNEDLRGMWDELSSDEKKNMTLFPIHLLLGSYPKEIQIKILLLAISSIKSEGKDVTNLMEKFVGRDDIQEFQNKFFGAQENPVVQSTDMCPKCGNGDVTRNSSEIQCNNCGFDEANDDAN